jgi:hypothetical protein
MKVVDRTPLQNEKGEILFASRVQGTLKYGLAWYAEMQAQAQVVARLNRVLEKGFVLIRNFALPNSEIIIPIILIGPGGVNMIYPTPARGFFEAKGTEWNIGQSGSAKPARVNLLERATRLTRALQVYLQRQQIELPAAVEPVLIAVDPGAHIESLRPAVRVVQSDAINAFAAALIQARPVLDTPFIHDLAERIVNPRPVEARQPQAAPASRAAAPTPGTPASRARLIFDASENAVPLNPSDVSFALEDEPGAPMGLAPGRRETSPARPLPNRSAAPRDKLFGMSQPQVLILVSMTIVECCVLIGFGALLTGSP